MIVVDLGCAYCDASDSVDILWERFHPKVIYGFDPRSPKKEWKLGKTKVVLSDLIAWTHDGLIQFREDGVASCVLNENVPLLNETMWLSGYKIPSWRECFDLAAWIKALPPKKIVVKFDVENAELDLLEHLISTGADKRLSLALIEWHCAEPEDRGRRDWILENLSCPWQDWGH